MAQTGRDRAQRAERERIRRYEARRELHERGARRRRRDDLIAGIAGGVLLLGIAFAQAAYYIPGSATEPEGTSAPVPTSTDTPAPAEEPTDAPSGAATPAQ